MYAVKLTDAEDAVATLTVSGVYVAGDLDLARGFSVYTSPRRADSLSPEPGHQFVAELRDDADQLISRTPVLYSRPCLPPVSGPVTGQSAHDVLLLDGHVPLSTGPRSLTLRDGDVVLVERWFPKEAPVVEAMVAEATSEGHYSLTWKAHHPDGVDLSSMPVVSTDGGSTWAPLSLVTSTLKEPLTVYVGYTPAGSELTFGVLVTDGLNTVMTLSAPIAAMPPPPEVGIINLTDHGRVASDVTLRGMSTWPVDEESGLSMAWSSSVQGELGQGAIVAVHLKAGQHAVTLTLRDAHDRFKQVSDTVIVHVS